MRPRGKLLCLLGLLLLVGCGSENASQPAVFFTLTDLGEGRVPEVVNDQGQVSGEDPLAIPRIFFWPSNRALKGQASTDFISGMNSRGDVAANAHTLSSQDYGWIDYADGSLYVFEPTETVLSLVSGINERGEVVGTTVTVLPDMIPPVFTSQKAFLWKNGTFTYLGVLPGMVYSDAIAQNNVGQVVGVSGPVVASAPGKAFLWEKGQMKALPSLPGFPDMEADSINDQGQIIGNASQENAQRKTSAQRAVLWQNGKVSDLGTLPGYGSSSASGVNKAGQVVGAALATVNGYLEPKRAVLWQQGAVIDLTTRLLSQSGWTLENAKAISNNGLIVGTGVYQGKKHGFLLKPKSLSP